MAIAPNTPKYIYSDGTTIAFETGNIPVITYGRNVPADGSLHELGDSDIDSLAFGGYDTRAQNMINDYNEDLIYEGLTPVTLKEKIVPPNIQNTDTQNPTQPETTPTPVSESLSPPSGSTSPPNYDPVSAPTNITNGIYVIEECINDTFDRFYIYMRQTWSDGTIRYYFKGKNIHARNEKRNRVKNIVDFDTKDPKLTLEYYFPDWFETGIPNKTYQTNYYGKMEEGPENSIENKYFSFHRWNKVNKDAIKSKVPFKNCKKAPPPPSKTLGLVVDSVTNQPIPGVNINMNPGKYTISQVTTNETNGSFIQFSSDSKGEFTIVLKELTQPPTNNSLNTPNTTNTSSSTPTTREEQLYQMALEDSIRSSNRGNSLALAQQLQQNPQLLQSNQQQQNNQQPTGSSNSLSKPPVLTFSKASYDVKTEIIYKGDLTPKKKLLILMDPALVLKPRTPIILPTQIGELQEPQKTPEYHKNKKLLDILKKILKFLIPILLGLLAAFGIKKLRELLDEELDGVQCPGKEEIDFIIKKKNDLVKQLNQLFKIIDLTTKTITAANSLIEIFSIAYQALKFLPAPIPPGLPISVVNLIQDSKEKFDKNITKLKGFTTATLAILVLLRQTLTQVIDYLNMLDILIQHCADDTEEEQVQINQELLELTQQQSQTSPVITVVNGFTMGVEEENTNNPLKRKRATATDTNGLIVLRGEWSFSSINQILIDELVFYIQVNDLKAN